MKWTRQSRYTQVVAGNALMEEVWERFHIRVLIHLKKRDWLVIFSVDKAIRVLELIANRNVHQTSMTMAYTATSLKLSLEEAET
jgi:hypothetical protein